MALLAQGLSTRMLRVMEVGDEEEHRQQVPRRVGATTGSTPGTTWGRVWKGRQLGPQ